MKELIFIFLVLIAAFLGYLLQLLTMSGTIAAIVVGVLINLGFGWKGLLLLGFFFTSSSLLSKYKKKQKQQIEARHEKGSTRDWQQVVANGGLPALFSVLFIIFPSPLFFIAFTITIASANSDTWASEIGSLSKRRPLSIKHFKQVEPGTSGAMSFLGTFAAIMGSFSIAIIAMLSYSLSFSTLFIIFVFGFLGNILDTLLGAFIQVTYRCPSCEMVVESKWHCNRKTVHMSGNTIVNNDLVNLSSCALASILGVLFFVTVAGG
ncbi:MULTISPECIES: DUF92 domain-containing protein [Cytobacillus]|uniref:DUF92 domain-containing protein n=1 Tax=Cytobacillus TaxID=2675230 RepID=UPI0039083CF9